MNSRTVSVPHAHDAQRDRATSADREPVIAIATYLNNNDRERAELQLDELEELATTLGANVIERLVVRLRDPNPATLIGKGAVDKLLTQIADLGRPTVLMNDELSPRQQRNLEQEWDVNVMDRTEVILEIFARRATSAEGSLQVEMAQLQHLLPRLAGGWTHLERQRGGVGLRGGPGETQIEVDRRLINHRIARLKTKLAQMERARTTRRSARTAVPLASVALVGYTNAGKSTLLNALTDSHVLTDNRLFATLDPTSRKLDLASGRRVIVTDTVGFIQALPTELVEAFAATLEEVRQAHILCVVVDVSHPDAEAQLTTVLETLEQMECDQPRLLVASKCDAIDAAERDAVIEELEEIADVRAIQVSSKNKSGLRELKQAFDVVAANVVPQMPAHGRHMQTAPRNSHTDGDA